MTIKDTNKPNAGKQKPVEEAKPVQPNIVHITEKAETIPLKEIGAVDPSAWIDGLSLSPNVSEKAKEMVRDNPELMADIERVLAGKMLLNLSTKQAMADQEAWMRKQPNVSSVAPSEAPTDVKKKKKSKSFFKTARKALRPKNIKKTFKAWWSPIDKPTPEQNNQAASLDLRFATAHFGNAMDALSALHKQQAA